MNQLFKIGLYVRVSTEEQAENPEGSIKNQEERLREFVKLKNHVSAFGEIKAVFTDAGISAKDMNRPALQRLLRQIANKEIDLVLVTELSRFTRSIKDFSILWDYLAKHGCKFLSIKDNFDTSTAAGELVMYMMANIAQFERKQTAERISHSFLARAKRGLYNGGTLPLGYEVDPEKPGHLKIVKDEAEVVREVFAVFLKQETLSKTAKYLNDKKIEFPRIPRGGGKLRTGIFRIDMVHTILRNKAYVGIRSYQTKNGTELCKAVWEPIINEDIFMKVQNLLTKNRYRKRSHLDQRYPFTLSGVTFCKVCGDRMAGKSAHGRSRKIPYYEHSWAMKNQAALSKKIMKCEPNRIQAEKIEPLVWQEVKRFLMIEETTKQMLELAKNISPQNSHVLEAEKLNKKVQAISLQMEALAERIARLPKGVDESIFMGQMVKLQETKVVTENTFSEIKANIRTEEVITYDDFKVFTAHLRELVKKADSNPEIQTAIIRKLVHKIEITPKGFEIDFFVGHTKIKYEVTDTPEQNKPARAGSPPLTKFLKISGSRRLTNGGIEASLGTPYRHLPLPHDIIKFFPKSQDHVFDVCAPLYEKNLSLSEISEQTGFSRSTIRDALNSHGVTVRAVHKRPTKNGKKARRPGRSTQPYGFTWLEGKLVREPSEYRIVLKIMKLWKSGKSLHAIAKELNDQKIATRMGKRWSQPTIGNIVKRPPETIE